MIADLKPYAAYKDSCAPWLGDVPEHWEVRSLGSLTSVISHRARPDLPLLSVVREKGVIPRSTMSDEENHNFVPDDLSNYKVVREGNLVINKMKAWQGSLGIAPMDGVVSPAYFVFDFKIGDKKYGQALLRSKTYVSFFAKVSDGVRIGQWDLSIDGMKRIPVVIPPLPEQSAIVRFLGWADRRIRRVIRARQKRIKLLEEQKQAIIHRAVTRGLDPNVRLKPSGVEWLGDVPEHWEVRRIKNVARLKSGESITSERINLTGDFAVYGGNGIRGFTSEYTHEGEFVLIGRQGALCGNINYAKGKFWASEHAVVSHPLEPFEVLWFGELLRVMNLNQYSIAAAQPGLAVERIGNLSIPVPEFSEQQLIATHIQEHFRPFDIAIAAYRREIELLKESRTRLIADVVTGKLDVRVAAASLPVEADEPEALAETDLQAEDDENTVESNPDAAPEEAEV